MVASIKKNFFDLISLLWRGYGFYKKQIAVLVVLGFFGGLLEGVGINAVIPVFSFLTGRGGVATDKISIFIEKAFNFLGIDFTLRYLLVFIFMIFVARAVLLLVNNYIKVKIITDYSERVRNRLFEKVLEADWPHLIKQKLGHLETLLMTNISNSETLLAQISGMIMLVTTLAMYLLIAVNISWRITALTVILGAILFFAFRPILNKVRKISGGVEKLNRDISHFVNENVTGLKTVKAMQVDRSVIEKGRVFFREIKQLRFKVFLLGVLPNSLMQPIGLLFVLVIFAFSYKAPNFNLASLAAVVYLIDRIFIYIQQLQGQFQAISELNPYLASVLRYEDEAILNREENTQKNIFSFKDSFEFQNVTFNYEEGKDVLHNINFKIKQGEMVGIIGPSGVGKTTVVDLVLRLFKPVSGKILIDGVDISDISLKDWRGSIGYVSQDMFLLNGSIENNIRFYNPNLSKQAIEEAAKMANIYDFIMSCPNKFNTFIGERGIMLSAGQRQRIIIARVLARSPKFLVLDEATSSLDNESEREIQSVIENLKGRVTVLIIAHRLSTVINTSKLIVLDKGGVAEEGAPEVLLKDQNSYFYRLYKLTN